MYFSVYALDKPGAGSLRAKHREEHRARLHQNEYPLKVIVAGPLLGADDTMIGSLLIVEAEAAEDVRAFIGTDPYWINGVYETVDVRAFGWGIGAPVKN